MKRKYDTTDESSPSSQTSNESLNRSNCKVIVGDSKSRTKSVQEQELPGTSKSASSCSSSCSSSGSPSSNKPLFSCYKSSSSSSSSSSGSSTDSDSDSDSSSSDSTTEEPGPSKNKSFKSCSTEPPGLKPFPAPKNILQIDEIYRQNFGTCDWEVGDCTIGKKFWYDDDVENLDKFKFFIRLHGTDEHPRNNQSFVLKAQYGLGSPSTFQLTLPDIIKSLRKIPCEGRRIWLDVRDYDVWSCDPLLDPSIKNSISHFSYGQRLYSAFETIDFDYLLEYILGHLPNLEYCSINSGMLFQLNEKLDLRPFPKLFKLKTIRIVHAKSEFPAVGLCNLLKMSPNLENVYGAPLHSIKWFGNTRARRKWSDSIPPSNRMALRSLCTQRDIYNFSESTAFMFLEDLKVLSEKEEKNTLQELDVRTFFLNCSNSTRRQCSNMMTKVMRYHRQSLIKLKLDHPCEERVEIPQLPNLKTLQFYLNIRRYMNGTFGQSLRDIRPFFTRDIDIRHKFPNLNSVELNAEFSRIYGKDKYKTSLLKLFDQHFPIRYSEHKHAFDQVQLLKLYGFVAEECIGRIAKMFPNIKVLRIHDDLMYVLEVLPKIYEEWLNLVALHLEINADTQRGNLDGPFSGLTTGRCARFQLKYPNPEPERIERCFQKYGENTPIWHLTDLRLLKIVIRPTYTKFVNVPKVPVLTKVGAAAILRLKHCACDNESKTKDFNDNDQGFQVQVAFDERVSPMEKEKFISSLDPIATWSWLNIEY